MENENKNSIAVFEEIRRDIVVANNKEVSISSVFGRGSTSGLASFGNRSLAENAYQVDLALQNVGELQQIWNHSHTQWMWKHLNLSWHSPYSNLRQISAEITNKKMAINEAKWRQIESEVKISKIEEELKTPEALDYWREVELKVKLAKYREGISNSVVIIEGAMKDILVLNDLYEQMKKRVSNFSEADVEQHQSKDHLRRSLTQCIRDIRMAGIISKGEQEYLEQIGVNPGKAQNLLRAYVEKEASSDSWDVSGLYEFVDKLTDELIDMHKVSIKRMELQGFNPEAIDDHSFTKKLGLLTNSSE